MAATGRYSVLRPSDLVSLTIRSTGLQERTSTAGVTEWVATVEGRLIVDLQPQHIAESVADSLSMQGRPAGPSSLHFIVPAGRVIPLSVEGVLAAADELELAGTPREQGRASTLELPWRLLLAVEHKARCRHRHRPAPSGNGVTAMWHTRILAPTPRSHAYSAVFPFASLPLERPFADSTPLGDNIAKIATRGRDHPDKPVAVDKLVLTTCGASFSGSVSYPDLEWTHRMAMGRDVYVRLLQRGVLFPFGHEASTVEVTERKFDPGTGVAGLHRTLTLVVTQPVLDYDIEAAHQREFPFHRVAIDPVLVTPLDRPASGARAYWLSRDGHPVMFTVHASSAGDVIPLHLPLLFAEKGTDVGHLNTLYAGGPREDLEADPAPPTAVVDRAVPLVVRRRADKVVEAVEGTEQHVRSLTLAATRIGSGTAFHPRIAGLEVMLPAVQQLLGQHQTIRATLAPEVAAAAGTGSPPDVLLQLPDKVPVNFAAARAAVAAAPSMAVDRIHRELGPTVANLPTDPAKLFDRAAKLLGVVPLVDIIGQVTGRPTITWSRTPTPRATLHWTESLTRERGPFEPLDDCRVTLDVRTELVNGRPQTTTDGTVTNFAIGIPSPEEDKYLVKLGFTALKFHAEPGELPETTLVISSARLGQQLKFVQKLSTYLPGIGAKAPTVDVGAREVRVRYALAVSPPPQLGVFVLQNLLLQAGITLSLGNDPVTVDFTFGTRDRPFLVTVMGFGGGGYLELGIRAGGDDSGLERFVGGIEFGAAVAMDFGVARGEVHVFGGVVFTKQGSKVEITGYLRIGGSLRVLGLVSVSVELTISLTYVEPNVLRGKARLLIAVDLTFWSTSVEITCEKTFIGSDETVAPRGRGALAAAGPSSVQQAWGPVGSSFPWHTYCQAFTRE
ncbi:hypothetical protein [Streptomyces sp. NRRL S-475]|uniref:hypothetical protein n=1 Tax=Streptomyces sp. NRRL S-475 TaxID=1463910 RepID=UPI00131C6BC6|nr:hypothetical protein [Streptomyces sp. NRRL S-475]